MIVSSSFLPRLFSGALKWWCCQKHSQALTQSLSTSQPTYPNLCWHWHRHRDTETQRHRDFREAWKKKKKTPLHSDLENKLPFIKYGWPLNNTGGRGTDHTPIPHSQKSIYNSWLPKNSTTNNLPLTRSLTNNIQSINFVCCIYYRLKKS